MSHEAMLAGVKEFLYSMNVQGVTVTLNEGSSHLIFSSHKKQNLEGALDLFHLEGVEGFDDEISHSNKTFFVRVEISVDEDYWFGMN